MNWGGWSQFWAMGGYGFYVWGTFGVTLLAIVAEVLLVRRHHRNARALIGRVQAAER